MKRILTRKRVVFLAVLAIAAATAVGAFAYFTTTGSGTGTATVGDATAIELSSPVVGDLYPGGADVPVTVTVHNPGGGNQYVATISGTVETQGDCLGSWFVVDPIDFKTDVDHGASVTAGTNVRMLDSGTSQNACKNLTMTIDWSSD